MVTIHVRMVISAYLNSQVSDRIKVVEQIRGDSIDKIYNEDQITTELVKNRVVNFIKDFYKIYV